MATYVFELNGCRFAVRNPRLELSGEIRASIRTLRQPGDRLYEHRQALPAEKAAMLHAVRKQLLQRMFPGACACGYRDPATPQGSRCPNCGEPRSSER